MRIVYSWDIPETRYKKTGDNGIQVNRTNALHLLSQQVKKKTHVEFQIEKGSPMEETTQSFL
jgi:hypothetical protein